MHKVHELFRKLYKISLCQTNHKMLSITTKNLRCSENDMVDVLKNLQICTILDIDNEKNKGNYWKQVVSREFSPQEKELKAKETPIYVCMDLCLFKCVGIDFMKIQYTHTECSTVSEPLYKPPTPHIFYIHLSPCLPLCLYMFQV